MSAGPPGATKVADPAYLQHIVVVPSAIVSEATADAVACNTVNTVVVHGGTATFESCLLVRHCAFLPARARLGRNCRARRSVLRIYCSDANSLGEAAIPPRLVPAERELQPPTQLSFNLPTRAG